ncbi:MAG: ATP-dependent zinc metalloprotease FtsH [Candidatus Firestonebacteria bacterium]
MKNNIKGIVIWLSVFLLLYVLADTLLNRRVSQVELRYDEFVESLMNGEVESIIVNELQQRIDGDLKNKKHFYVYFVSDPDLWKLLREKKVNFLVKAPDQFSWFALLINLAPFIFIVLIFYFLYKQMQGAGSSAFSFIKSRAKLFTSNQPKVTFNDVAGVEEAKEELKEVIMFLKEPQKFTKLGGKIPRGVLLLGIPGIGKTLLARAVAGEAGVPFFSISGSDFVELFVGVGAARVRDLFEQGRKNAPCIIFIDELDAVGRKRGSGIGGGHDEREQTLNQLLVEMDGFDTNINVIVMAATNRDDVLDPALLRPGRFDRRVVVDPPNLKGREEILKIHTRKVPISKDIDLKVVARGTPGFTGADLANLVNEAALIAAKKDQKEVAVEDMEEARDKIIMGLEKKSIVIVEKERKTMAYHEGGHALIGKLLPDAEPLHKVTIIPRGKALGVTWHLPKEDRYTRTKHEFLNDITILMGGRSAEELFLNDITTGAQNDLHIATLIAHKMVCEYGMSKVLGNRTFGRPDREIFIGGEYFKEKDYGEDIAKVIDKEVKKIIDECYEKAKDLLIKNKYKLEKIAIALLEKEILDGQEVDEIIKEASKVEKVKKNVAAGFSLRVEEVKKMTDTITEKAKKEGDVNNEQSKN